MCVEIIISQGCILDIRVKTNFFVSIQCSSVLLETMKSNICFLVFLAIFSAFAEGARILGVFPIPSKSHALLGQPIFVELAKRGHEVVFISPFPMENPPKGYRDIALTEKEMFEIYDRNMQQTFESN